MKENIIYKNENNDASEKLYDAITRIDDKLVEKASGYDFSTPGRYKSIWIATAASICLVFGIGFAFIWGPAGGGGSAEPGSSYMAYMGPIFPLTSTSNIAGIEVTRHTDWDFSPYESEIITEEMHPDIPENTETFTYDKYESESIVTDSYVLTNSTDKDITLSVLYPFAGRFTDAMYTLPKISLDGTSIETGFLAGKYSGSYSPAWGDEDSNEQLNLNNIGSWEGYKALLSDGTYLQDTYREYPSLNIPIIVYEYSDLIYTGEQEASNPTLAVQFDYDINKSTITGWGFNGGGWEGNGKGYYSCSRVYIPGGNEIDKDAKVYFIVIGEDIKTPTLQGYQDGGCDKGEEIDGVTATLTKYETTLEDFIWNVCLVDLKTSMENGTLSTEDGIYTLLNKEMVLGSVAQLMYDDGILSEEVIERYDTGWLEEYVYDYVQMLRVMYVTFDITIPAGSSITVEASMIKDASIDYLGKADINRNGYDMVTTLASSFTFSKQTASITNSEFIEILGQNFGFDLENGITKVELDLKEEHYWMDIRKKMNEE